LLGDHAAARHLAYYAELRAAMSILAARGVGIFDQQHFAVTGPTSVEKIPGTSGTHMFTWQALQWWSGLPDSWNLVGDVIRPYGKTLNEWLAAVPKYAAWGSVASGWIESLGLDIQRVASDQYSRNEASYRPNRMVEPATSDASLDARFAVNLWRALEPGATGFPNLDVQLLRVTLERAFEAVEGAAPSRLPAAFAAAAAAVSNVAGEPSIIALLDRFLRREIEPADLDVITFASADSPTSKSQHHMEVMSRAANLLVLATTSARKLLIEARAPLDEISFWWQSLGFERGIWATAPATAELQDLWDDVNDQLVTVEDWLDRDDISHSSAQLRLDNPTIYSQLAYLELPALWGMSA